MPRLRRHWISQSEATNTAGSKNLSDAVREMRWQGANRIGKSKMRIVIWNCNTACMTNANICSRRHRTSQSFANARTSMLCAIRHRTFCLPHPFGLAIRLLRVTLRAQPRDAAFAVHPLVDFGFAFETSNVNRLDARTLGQDIPIVLGNSHRFETYFCFGHGLLWQQFGLKSKGMAQS